MLWYLLLGYLAACYLWGLVLVVRLATGRRVLQLVAGASFARRTSRGTPALAITGDELAPTALIPADTARFPHAEAA